MPELLWGPRPGAFAGAGFVTAGGVLWLLLAGSSEDRLVAAIVSLAGLIAAGLIFRLRRRLAAGPAGLRIGMVSGVLVVPWSGVRGVEVVTRQRMGTASQTLEVDLDDDSLLVFGRFDLGTDPAIVAAALSELRTGRP